MTRNQASFHWVGAMAVTAMLWSIPAYAGNVNSNENNGGQSSDQSSGKGVRQTGSTLTFYPDGRSGGSGGKDKGGCGCKADNGLHAGPI